MARRSSEEGGGFSLWLSAELLPQGRRSFLTVVDDEFTGLGVLLPGEEVPPLSLLPGSVVPEDVVSVHIQEGRG